MYIQIRIHGVVEVVVIVVRIRSEIVGIAQHVLLLQSLASRLQRQKMLLLEFGQLLVKSDVMTCLIVVKVVLVVVARPASHPVTTTATAKFRQIIRGSRTRAIFGSITST